jgi:hypothetical protein
VCQGEGCLGTACVTVVRASVQARPLCEPVVAHKVAERDAVDGLLAEPGVRGQVAASKVPHNPCKPAFVGEECATSASTPGTSLPASRCSLQPPVPQQTCAPQREALTWQLLEQSAPKVSCDPGCDEAERKQHAPGRPRRRTQRLLGDR